MVEDDDMDDDDDDEEEEVMIVDNKVMEGVVVGYHVLYPTEEACVVHDDIVMATVVVEDCCPWPKLDPSIEAAVVVEAIPMVGLVGHGHQHLLELRCIQTEEAWLIDKSYKVVRGVSVKVCVRAFEDRHGVKGKRKWRGDNFGGDFLGVCVPPRFVSPIQREQTIYHTPQRLFLFLYTLP